MNKYFSLLMAMVLLAFILVACNNDATDTVRNTADDIRNVNFGPGTGTNETPGQPQGPTEQPGRNTPAYPFGTDRNENNNETLFPFQSDRGFDYDQRYDFDGDEHTRRPNTEQNREANPNRNNQTAQNNEQGTTGVDQNIHNFVEEVVRLTNQERERNGLQPLQIDEQLNRVAQAKSKDMADNGYFSHQSPTYGSPFDMLQQFGVDYTTAAENIAAGQESPESVVNVWMNSEGHRANILNESVTHIGVGYEEGGSMRTYWTQLFIAK